MNRYLVHSMMETMGREAKGIKHEVSTLKSRLYEVGGSIEKSTSAGKQLNARLENIRKAQGSFEDRIEMISRQLGAYKAFAAKFSS